jgi:nucleoside-diphosphate-sugar epimerase
MKTGSKVLVTGGAGYLGAILVPELLKTGCLVTVLDNFMFQQTPLLDCCSDGRFSVVRGDVRDEETLKRLLLDADFILPLAALEGVRLCEGDRAGAVSTNRDAVATLVKLASRDQRIILPNTGICCQ